MLSAAPHGPFRRGMRSARCAPPRSGRQVSTALIKSRLRLEFVVRPGTRVFEVTRGLLCLPIGSGTDLVHQRGERGTEGWLDRWIHVKQVTDQASDARVQRDEGLDVVGQTVLGKQLTPGD